MARLVVGGVDCAVEDGELTIGHVVIPFRDLLACGIADSSRELIVAYERRAPVEVGYRDQRAKGKPATVTVPLSGDAEVLMSLLREYAPHAWRGYCMTADDVLGGNERSGERAPPIQWGRWIVWGAGVVVGVLFTLFVSVWLAE